MSSEKVCIIGAGSSGVVAAKILKEKGIPLDCFEMASDIGGNWRYNNDNGRSAAYDSLHIDTSKDRMQFSDFPMPDGYPNFPHHTQVLAYFESYADHFNVKPTITFHTKIDNVSPAPGGGYDVAIFDIDSGEQETRHYGAVLVCNGHHWQPKIPKFPGEFIGRSLHSRNFRTAEPFKDENVLVIGIGNSGVDIACDIASSAKQVYLSTRRSAYIIPRYILGKPTDKWVTESNSQLPFPITRAIYSLLLKTAVGNQENYGVPKPDHKLLSEHPTMSSQLLDNVAHGSIIIKPNIAELAGNAVSFFDGSTVPIDSIVYATGYQISFPFFDDSFISFDNNEFPLYRRVVHPDYPGLYFIGLIQPLGAIMPLAELQCRWVAGLINGTYTLPDSATMKSTIREDQSAINKRYVNSSRHTIQVDFFPYKRSLQKEMQLDSKKQPKPALIAAAFAGGVLGAAYLISKIRD
jgi:dimethylaniline monooxygenase (N-oxide forming)